MKKEFSELCQCVCALCKTYNTLHHISPTNLEFIFRQNPRNTPKTIVTMQKWMKFIWTTDKKKRKFHHQQTGSWSIEGTAILLSVPNSMAKIYWFHVAGCKNRPLVSYKLRHALCTMGTHTHGAVGQDLIACYTLSIINELIASLVCVCVCVYTLCKLNVIRHTAHFIYVGERSEMPANAIKSFIICIAISNCTALNTIYPIETHCKILFVCLHPSIYSVSDSSGAPTHRRYCSER